MPRLMTQEGFAPVPIRRSIADKVHRNLERSKQADIRHSRRMKVYTTAPYGDNSLAILASTIYLRSGRLQIKLMRSRAVSRNALRDIIGLLGDIIVDSKTLLSNDETTTVLAETCFLRSTSCYQPPGTLNYISTPEEGSDENTTPPSSPGEDEDHNTEQMVDLKKLDEVTKMRYEAMFRERHTANWQMSNL